MNTNADASVNTAGIQKGMDVFGTDGEKIGSVGDIVNVQATSTTGPTTGGYQVGQGSYLKIDQGGILGIGAKELYVPFTAVSNVVPGDNLTINCTKDTCDNLYGNKPDFLS